MSNLERHMFTSDYHCPDQNEKAIHALCAFIREFRPNFFHINGDFVNFSSVSKYDQDPHFVTGLRSEVKACRELLDRIVKVVRSSNPKVKIYWEEGNHETRLIKYLLRNASQLANLEIDDEDIVSIPHIFKLKKLGITWIPAGVKLHIQKELIVEHGDKVKKRAGDTAKFMLDDRNVSGVSGHTHRLAVHYRKTYRKLDFWIETGCLCNLHPTPSYVASPDWQNGFAIGIYDPSTKIMHPMAIPILNDTFMYGGKLYQ